MTIVFKGIVPRNGSIPGAPRAHLDSASSPRVGAGSISLAFALLLSGLATAQPGVDPLDALETDLREILESSPVVGASIVLLEDAAVVRVLDYGWARRADPSRPEPGRSVDAHTRFRVGSISKNLTSLLILRSIEEGVLDLDARAIDFIPELRVENPWQASDPIRLAHLLEHTAGLPGSSYREYARSEPDVSPAEYARWISPVELRWRPGALHSYSNSGAALAARMLETATERDFDELAASELFEPLGMSTATFRTAGSDPDAVSESYGLDGEPIEGWQLVMRPAGSASMTSRDLAKLVSLYLRRGLDAQGRRFASTGALERMERGERSLAAEAGAGETSYGLGSFRFGIDGRLYQGHWGKTEGFVSSFGYRPDSGRGFVILLNTRDSQTAAALRSRVGEYLSRDLPAPELASEVASHAWPVDEPAGYYVNATHGMPLRGWLFAALDQRHLTREGERLRVASVGVGQGGSETYRRGPGRSFVGERFVLPTAALAKEGSDLYWIDGAAFRRVPALERFWLTWTPVAALMAALLGLARAVTFAVRSRSGRGGESRRGRQRLLHWAAGVTSLALLATVGLFAHYGLFGATAELRAVGTLSLPSLALAVASALAGWGGLLLLPVSIVALRSQGRGAAALTLAIALPLLSLSILWFREGWVFVRTWA